VAAAPFAGYEVDEALRPSARQAGFDLEARLASVVALEAQVSPAAWSAKTLGTQRIGNAVVIDEAGLMLTIGYLITEADEVVVTSNAGDRIEAYPLGVDQATGLGLLHALEPLGLPAAPIGDSRILPAGTAVISAGGGGRAHALCARIAARAPFPGYWEYYLDEALFVEPGHPHWSGAALFDPAGEVVGVGSLQMEQLAPGGEVRPINMFVPAELLMPIRDSLTRGRPARPPRPWLGVLAQEIESHVVVVGVSPGGPASRAELRRGDIVHRLAGERVSDLAGFYQRLWSLGAPGVVARLRIQRERDVFDVEIRTADRTALQRRRRLN